MTVVDPNNRIDDSRTGGFFYWFPRVFNKTAISEVGGFIELFDAFDAYWGRIYEVKLANNQVGFTACPSRTVVSV